MKRKNIGVVLFLSLVVTMFASCGGNDIRPEKALSIFSKEIEKGHYSGLRLTIYYLSPNVFTLYPISVDDLINRSYEYKYEIDGAHLEEHSELLKQISNIDLIPAEEKPPIDVRIYYVFKNVKGKKIFDVAIWGDDDSVYINGIGFKENDAYYNVIIPFLTEEIAEEFEAYLEGKGQ